MIEPFFFKQDLLFGCYHPAVDFDSSRLLIICPPFFDDYRRSYRALSILANTCAEQGVHVLRFDYYGTGESQGLLDDASVDGWKDDIYAAIEEGIALSGAGEVVVLGIRFGATLAAQVVHPKISRYLFWDPVTSGIVYLEWLDTVNNILKQQHRELALNARVPFESMSYENFHITSALKNEISSLVFNPTVHGKEEESFIITTDQSVSDAKMYSHCEFPGLHYDWPAYHDGIFLPSPVLEALARRVISR